MAEDFSTSNLNEAKFHASLMIRTVAFSTSDSVGALSSYVTAAAGAAFIAAISTGSSIAAALGANVLAAWLFTCVVTMVIGFAAKGAGTGVQAAKAAYEMGAKETDRLGGSASYDISPLPIDVQRLVLKAAPFGERWIARHRGSAGNHYVQGQKLPKRLNFKVDCSSLDQVLPIYGVCSSTLAV